MKGSPDLYAPAKCCTWTPDAPNAGTNSTGQFNETGAFKCDYDVDGLGAPAGRNCPAPSKKELDEWMERMKREEDEEETKA